MAKKSKREVTIAVIGLIGVLATAVFSNWDKIFERDKVLEATVIGYKPTNDIEIEYRHIMNLMGIRSQMDLVMEQLASEYIKHNGAWDNNPVINKKMSEAFKKISREFFDINIRKQIPFVKDIFTLDELQRLNKFYSTSEMRSFIKKLPLLLKAMMPVMKENRQEMEIRLRKAFKEIRDSHNE